MRQGANEMTRATNYKEKRLLDQARGISILYTYVFLTYTNVSVLGHKVLSFFLFFFYPIPHIWILIFILYLNTNHLNLTLGGLRLHSQDIYLIRNILVSFYPAILAVHGHFVINATEGVVVLYLMRKGCLLHPSSIIFLVFCAESTFFPF